jgi:hypothetical protein
MSRILSRLNGLPGQFSTHLVSFLWGHSLHIVAGSRSESKFEHSLSRKRDRNIHMRCGTL